MTQSFAEWVWQGIMMLTKTRSEKEYNIGMFLLLSGIVWVFLPLSSIRVILQFVQVIMGTVLVIHGLYLKSVELAEKGRIGEEYSKRRMNEWHQQLREMTIKRFAEADGISLEEASKKADETEWIDPKGNVISPPWLIQPEESKG